MYNIDYSIDYSIDYYYYHVTIKNTNNIILDISMLASPSYHVLHRYSHIFCFDIMDILNFIDFHNYIISL
jgi:hypothetical protein